MCAGMGVMGRCVGGVYRGVDKKGGRDEGDGVSGKVCAREGRVIGGSGSWEGVAGDLG